jgi:hypothetical protein
MRAKIANWGVVKDEITESVKPTCRTELEVTFEPLPSDQFRSGDDVEYWIALCKLEIMNRSRRGEHNLVLANEHPFNSDRLKTSRNMDVKLPLFLSDFTIREHEDSLWVYYVDLNYRSAEEMENPADKVPPDMGSWTHRYNVYNDPNDGTPFRNTAGDWIKDVEEEREFPAFHYTWFTEERPKWLSMYGANVVNSDGVRIDGEYFKEGTLMTARPVCRVVQQKNGQARKNELDILVNPLGWKRRWPNVGYRERKLDKDCWGTGTSAALPTEKEYNLVQKRFDDPTIQEMFFQSYKRPARLLQPITTVFNGDDKVTEPVALDKYGMAYRRWLDDATPYNQANVSRRDFPLMDPLEPKNLITLEFRTKLFLPYAPMRLW